MFGFDEVSPPCITGHLPSVPSGFMDNMPKEPVFSVRALLPKHFLLNFSAEICNLEGLAWKMEWL